MPYRTNTLGICNEGLAFVDNHIYGSRKLVAGIADSVARGIDEIMLLFGALSGVPRNCLAFPNRELLSQRLQEYFLGEEPAELPRLDNIFLRHHDAMLDEMMLQGGISGMEQITSHLAWGHAGDTYDVLKLSGSEHAERYWQSLLIDYALTQSNREAHLEVAVAASRMKPACFDFTVRRLFEKRAYDSLEQVMGCLVEMWPYFEFAKWEHFDEMSSSLSDESVLTQENLFTRFHYREGLSRILRIRVSRDDDAGAERVAREIYSYKEDGSVAALRALFDAYIGNDRRGHAIRIFERLREEVELGEDDFMREASRAESRRQRADDYDARQGMISLARLVLAGNGVK